MLSKVSERALRNSKDQIVAVIIETKLTSHSQFHHAVAQIIGYYITLKTAEDLPTLMFVGCWRRIDYI